MSDRDISVDTFHEQGRNRVWDYAFLEMAGLVSTWSKDPSTRVGSVIVEPRTRRVLSVGYNGFPRGVHDSPTLASTKEEHIEIERRFNERPYKYLWAEHAERNAIYNARTDLEWATLYVTPLPPCADCARGIIQSGIKRVVTYDPIDQDPALVERWKPNWEVTETMFKESGVEYVLL